MTVEKHLRDAKKKRKAEEKRELRRKKKEQTETETAPDVEAPIAEEPSED